MWVAVQFICWSYLILISTIVNTVVESELYSWGEGAPLCTSNPLTAGLHWGTAQQSAGGVEAFSKES